MGWGFGGWLGGLGVVRLFCWCLGICSEHFLSRLRSCTCIWRILLLVGAWILELLFTRVGSSQAKHFVALVLLEGPVLRLQDRRLWGVPLVEP